MPWNALRPATSSSARAAAGAARAGGAASAARPSSRDADAARAVAGRDRDAPAAALARRRGIARGQRGANTQPGGRAPGAGTRPGIAASRRARRRCRGSRRSACACTGARARRRARRTGPSSTMRPAYITSTRCGQGGDDREVVADVERGRVVAPAQLAHRREHVRLRRDVEAGRRLVEHDHARVAAGTRSRGRRAAAGRPRAGAGSAAGARASAGQAHLGERREDRARRVGAARRVLARCTSRELRADAQRGVERRGRDPAARTRRACRAARRSASAARARARRRRRSRTEPPAIRVPRRAWPSSATRDRRLARARLADEPGDLARRELEADVVDDLAAAASELDAQVARPRTRAHALVPAADAARPRARCPR